MSKETKQKKKKQRRFKWIGKVIYANGYFRSAIVKNNKPIYDVIRIELYKETKIGKTGLSIRHEGWDLTVDEAMATVFLLSKAIMVYVLSGGKARQDIRLWEYKDALKTLKVIKKKKNDNRRTKRKNS